MSAGRVDVQRAAMRTDLCGPVVRARYYANAGVMAEVRHVRGAHYVTLHLIRDGEPVLVPQTFRADVEAILASRDLVAGLAPLTKGTPT